MWIEILAHIGIPFAAGLVLLLVIAASGKTPISWDSCNDIALDLTILSAGASGGIFANASLIQNLGQNAAIYGILVVLCDFIFAGLLVYLKRWRSAPANPWSGSRDLLLGFITVGFTAGVLGIGLGRHIH
jgi:hypothetical protein